MEVRESGFPGSIVAGVEAGIVCGLIYVNPRRTRDSPGRDFSFLIWEGRLKSQLPTLGSSDSFGQTNGGSEVGILAHDDCGIILPVVSGADQVHRHADVYPLLLSARTYSAHIHRYALAHQTRRLVSPECVQEGVNALRRHSSVKPYFMKNSTRIRSNQGTRQLIDIIARPSISSIRPPCCSSQVVQVLAIN